MSRGRRAGSRRALGGSRLSVRRLPPSLLVALLLALCAGLLFPAAIVGGKVVSANDAVFFQAPFISERPPGLTKPSNIALGDAYALFDPQMLLARQDLRGGALPAWDPYVGAGQPLLATQEPAPFYPIYWLGDVFPFWHSLAYMLALKVVLAGLGMFLFLSALGLPTAGNTIAAIAFALSTPFVSFLEHPPTNVVALLPWALWLGDRLLTAPSLRRASLFALALGVQTLGGHPEMVFLSWLVTVAYLLFRLRQTRRGVEAIKRGALYSLGGFAAAIAVGAIVLIPLIELGTHAYVFTRGSPPLPLKSLLGLALPEFWGRPDKVEFGGPGGTFASHAFFIGALPMLLAPLGVLRSHRREARWFAVIGAISVLVVVDTPVLSTAARHIPLVDRVNLFWLIMIAMFCGAALASYGWEVLTTDPRSRVVLTITAAIAIAPLLVLVGKPSLLTHLGQGLRQLPTLSHNVPSEPVANLGSVLHWALFAGLAFVLLVLARLRVLNLVILGLLGVALTAADLVLIGHGYHPVISQSLAAPPAPASVRWVKSDPSHPRVAGVGEAFGPDISIRYGLDDARAENLPAPNRYTRLWLALGGSHDVVGVQRTLVVPSSPGVHHLLDLFGTKYLFASAGAPTPPWLTVGFRQGSDLVLVNPTALPRAWFTSRWRPATGLDQAIDLIRGSSTRADMRDPAIEGVARGPDPPSRSVVSPVSYSRRSDTEVELAVDAPVQGYVIVLDSFYPGWKAYVDGRATSIHPANAGFEAVRVPAGQHRVVLRYQSVAVRLGLWVTIAAVVLLVVALLATPALWRRRQRADHVA